MEHSRRNITGSTCEWRRYTRSGCIVACEVSLSAGGNRGEVATIINKLDVACAQKREKVIDRMRALFVELGSQQRTRVCVVYRA